MTTLIGTFAPLSSRFNGNNCEYGGKIGWKKCSDVTNDSDLALIGIHRKSDLSKVIFGDKTFLFWCVLYKKKLHTNERWTKLTFVLMSTKSDCLQCFFNFGRKYLFSCSWSVFAREAFIPSLVTWFNEEKQVDYKCSIWFHCPSSVFKDRLNSVKVKG